ncbi:hypothetical protein NBRC10512_007368 [Rhodotorula toruloides]|uniref:RHTO0S12e02256g1_1 n=2 Tax=Rhodotorula toruloides TaxID=5286 RepID=A0A061B8M4_RHOTO|nr:DUF231 domain containing protein [Rhodotorula toruloides NP11]EMS23241.1 DUF231 domain containing protein [Rhodotorula toruloides NP11]CDR46269.1 RHTO0S12e02256g1_1 [Rhodotorula toruloides]
MTGYPYTALSPLQRRRRQWYWLFAVAVILLFFSAATYSDALPDLPTLSTFSRLRYCRNDEIAEGSWVPAPVDGRTWARLKVSAGYTCHDNRHALMCFTSEPSELPRLAAANSWRWQPRDCQLHSFDAAAFVRRLSRNTRQGKKGSGILFVGDSLQLQHSQSFECLMGDHIERDFLSDYEVGNFSLEDGAGQIGFVRTDYLLQPEGWKLLMPDEEEPADIGRFVRKWTHMVEDKEFVVVNTGAHWGDHAPPTLARYERMTKEIISFIDRYPHITLIVRSSVPGHNDCSRYSAPLIHDDPEMHNSYNWQGFDLYNDIWRKTLEQHPKHIFLDVGATRLRPDGHRMPDKDCLHYCLPGPVDWWNRLLYHVIMGL